ncbi:MAG: tetratricopeptide repeat protein [Magnetococcales bacterium]|nr:tetratricopeptide repeat protein [Magnetococcales bacterium]MBF0151179.1 tetratricopeptide repeat protein [Magnetococcales bacterium]MBF0174621.1 tetratricopeptide repeat protein [Magnetococcales bacterium]MBF0632661.1 tetratricopeptide repeat protein [Magnetococcales bacterium]
MNLHRLPHLLNQARQHFQAGHLDEAGHGCLEILAVDQKNHEALHLLGVIAHQRGRHDEAAFLIRRAIDEGEKSPESHNNLGNALKAMGKLDEAVARYRHALTLRPDYANAHNNLGTALQEQGKPREAIEHFQKALSLLGPMPQVLNNIGNAFQDLSQWDEAVHYYRQALTLLPRFPEALNNLGRALVHQGKVEEGLERLAEAVEIKPDYVDALVNLGRAMSDNGQKDDAVMMFRRALDVEPTHEVACHSLGSVFQELGRLDESMASYHRALELNPNHHEALTNLGVALLDRGELDEAVTHFERAIAVLPTYVLAWNNLGVARQNQNRMEESAACYERALALKPDYYEALNNLGVARYKQNRLMEAIELFMKVQEMAPEYPDAYYNEGMARLAIGDFQRGWQHCEWRLKMRAYQIAGHSQPIMDQAMAKGRQILLHCEQGMGDSIQMIRYAAMIKEMGATVVVFCPKALTRLFATVKGIDFLSDDPELIPPCDHRIPILSLPLFCQTHHPDRVPTPIPYLFANPDRVAVMRDQFKDAKGLKVGLVWRGNPGHSNDRNRSLDVTLMSRLLEIQGCRFVNLQLGLTEREQAVFAGRTHWMDMSAMLSDFADTAAVVTQLDLVITVDTSVAHLTGALGRPAWVLLPKVADWRWLQERDDSPWYPTLRLFRQPDFGDWETVMTQVAQKLAQSARGELPPVWSLDSDLSV